MVDFVIKNGNVVFPTGIMCTGIAIDEGKIVAIAPEPYLPASDRTIDAEGKYVIPGFVDGHDHTINQFKIGEKTLDDCFRAETKAAAVGGVTTIGNMIHTPHSIVEEFDNYVRTYNDVAVVDGIFHFMADTWQHMRELHKCPDLGIVTIGELGGYKGTQAEKSGKSYVDDGLMYAFFEVISKWGPPGRAVLHAENIDVILLIKDKITAEGRKDCAAWTASRPSFCEAEKMRCYIELAKATKCPIYFVHVTIGEGVDIISKAKSEGVDVIAETCPQYLTVTKDDLTAFPPVANVNPPLRDKEDIDRLWQGIRDGWIETVATDHSTWTKQQKGNDIMRGTCMGAGNVLATWMPVMLSEGVNKGRITMEKMVEVCCYNPAKWLGILPKKGTISIGSDADIVIVDMNKKAIPRTADLYSHCDVSYYEIMGMELTGWPAMTMLRGNIVMENGKVIGKEGSGEYIKRKLFRNM